MDSDKFDSRDIVRFREDLSREELIELQQPYTGFKVGHEKLTFKIFDLRDLNGSAGADLITYDDARTEVSAGFWAPLAFLRKATQKEKDEFSKPLTSNISQKAK